MVLPADVAAIWRRIRACRGELGVAGRLPARQQRRRAVYHTPAFFCAKQTHRHGMKVPRKTTVETKMAPFHLFFAKSAWNMKVGLFACPPPPMPAPMPRAATRCDSLLTAELLQRSGAPGEDQGMKGAR